MEKYSDFLKRINYQQAELQIAQGDFVPNGRVCQKVNSDNSFKPFFGDTVVFNLGNRYKSQLAALTDELYKSSSECFCQKLAADTYHVTLHDLSASDSLDSVSSEVFYNEIKLISLLRKYPISSEKIKMKSNFIINMVNTSLVLTLIPEDAKEWDKLQELYSLIDQIKLCPYPFLTPHVTLAYFNFNGFNQESSEKLKAKVTEMNQQSIEITLHTKKLFYQKFVDMNSYSNIFCLHA